MVTIGQPACRATKTHSSWFVKFKHNESADKVWQGAIRTHNL